MLFRVCSFLAGVLCLMFPQLGAAGVGGFAPSGRNILAASAPPSLPNAPDAPGGGTAPSAPAASCDAPDPSDVGRNAAAAVISGSVRLGIIEHQIFRSGRPGRPEINLSYPSVGDRAVDADIRQWAAGIADAFDLSFDGDASPGGEGPAPELWGAYSITRPSAKALSVTFEIWTYTGGAHGNLDILTLNYSLLTGQRLGLVDLFEDPDTALALMAEWSRRVLKRRLGGMAQDGMLREGLATAPENFASLTLVPTGVRINFQPYQVAPWAAGAQRVDMPLEALSAAKPLTLLWGR